MSSPNNLELYALAESLESRTLLPRSQPQPAADTWARPRPRGCGAVAGTVELEDVSAQLRRADRR